MRVAPHTHMASIIQHVLIVQGRVCMCVRVRVRVCVCWGSPHLFCAAPIHHTSGEAQRSSSHHGGEHCMHPHSKTGCITRTNSSLHGGHHSHAWCSARENMLHAQGLGTPMHPCITWWTTLHGAGAQPAYTTDTLRMHEEAVHGAVRRDAACKQGNALSHGKQVPGVSCVASMTAKRTVFTSILLSCIIFVEPAWHGITRHAQSFC